jgi:AcrR family transcriptional regulator
MVGGRKKIFDEHVALEAAMDVFWEKGYLGASLADLTHRMGINKPSMYSTFGNKEALFIKATHLYCKSKIQSFTDILSDIKVPLKQRLKAYLMSVVSVQCESDNPKGCYIILCESEVASGELPQEASSLLIEAGQYAQNLLEETLQNEIETKRSEDKEQSKIKALCLASTLRGTASLARSGYSMSNLEAVIDHSLKGIGFE